jgi:hypothetical protein
LQAQNRKKIDRKLNKKIKKKILDFLQKLYKIVKPSKLNSSAFKLNPNISSFDLLTFNASTRKEHFCDRDPFKLKTSRELSHCPSHTHHQKYHFSVIIFFLRG